MVLSCGGHPPPLILKSDGKVQTVDCAGTLLGVLDEPEMTDYELDLYAGDTLLLYTDGVTEAEDSEDEFGEDGSEALLERCAGMNAEDMSACVERRGRRVPE